MIRWPGAPGGRVSSEIVDSLDLFPTLAAAAGEPDVVEKLKKGADYGGKTYKVHLDGYDQTDLFTGKSYKSARKFVFYYDEAVLTAIRYEAFKVSFSVKEGGRWDNPLLGLGRPHDQQSAHGPLRAADWRRGPSVCGAQDLGPHARSSASSRSTCQTFQEFPVRQIGLSAQMGKTIEGIQSQLLRLQNKTD